MATCMLWLGVLILSVYTGGMFKVMHNAGTFGFFSACTLISFAFFHFFLRETKGLSREQAQVLYTYTKGEESESEGLVAAKKQARNSISRSSLDDE